MATFPIQRWLTVASNHPLIIFAGIYVCSLAVFMAHYYIVGSGVWGDGRYYYSYVHSVIIDKDINFANEALYYHYPIQETQTGLVANKFSLGPALLWTPSFLMAHFLAYTAALLNLSIRADGYSDIYQILVGAGAVGYAVGGAWFCYRVAKRYASNLIALMATIGVYFGTHLFFYGAVDPINSHSVSFFIAALLIWLWHKDQETPKLESLLGMGILVGLLGMIRTQDLIFGLIPCVSAFASNRTIKTKIAGAGTMAIGIALGFVSQLVMWRALFGSLQSPYLLLGETFDWYKPQILSVLFSPNNGLLYYSPLLVLAIWGLWKAKTINRSVSIVGFILVGLQLYVVGSWHSWWGGEAFGSRMFISLMPFFIIGLTVFLRTYQKYFRLLIPLLVIASGCNFWMIIEYLLHH